MRFFRLRWTVWVISSPLLAYFSTYLLGRRVCYWRYLLLKTMKHPINHFIRMRETFLTYFNYMTQFLSRSNISIFQYIACQLCDDISKVFAAWWYTNWRLILSLDFEQWTNWLNHWITHMLFEPMDPSEKKKPRWQSHFQAICNRFFSPGILNDNNSNANNKNRIRLV